MSNPVEGAAWEPIKELAKRWPVSVAGVFLAVYYFPWTRARVASYELALAHPGALFYIVLVLLAAVAALTLVAWRWRRDRVRRHVVVARAKQLKEQAAHPARCPHPTHSMDELAFYEKLVHAGVLWDVKLTGHAASNPSVNNILVVGNVAYCPRCKTTALSYHRNSSMNPNYWTCPGCNQETVLPRSSYFGAIVDEVCSVSFAQYKKEHPSAVNNQAPRIA